MTNKIQTTHSAKETQAIAAQFAAQLTGGEFITLQGDLGAGKTTFTKGLVAALGSSARVKSPTFTVMNEYVVTNHPSITRVVHCDFYRFTKASELGALELEGYRNPSTVIIAEWPDALPTVEWNPDYTVVLEHGGGDERKIIIH